MRRNPAPEQIENGAAESRRTQSPRLLMTNKSFIDHQFFCANSAGSHRGGDRGANKNRRWKASELPQVGILPIDVTILQQNDGT
jgi:hypothetical protein